MRLVGASTSAKVTGLDELPGKSNYFVGSDPKKWRTNVSNYGKVQFQDVYPGIDLVYYGDQRQLEYDWIVRPGADPAKVVFAIQGADQVRVNHQGDLEIRTSTGEVRFLKPVVYQEKEPEVRRQKSEATNDARHLPLATRHFLNGRFVLLAKNQVGFEVGKYDRSRPLVIDPTLSYSTYLGGTNLDQPYGIAVDSSGNAYVTGLTQSTDFPISGGLGSPNNALQGGKDAFVTKINATGTALVYSTFLGGTAPGDQGRAIAVDSSGNAYVTGSTTSSDFPVTTGAYQTTLNGGGNLFATKLNSSGNALLYSTYLGGTGGAIALGIAIDKAATPNIYVTGFTRSSNYPTTTGAFQTSCPTCGTTEAAFVSKIAPLGGGSSDLAYSSYLGGGSTDFGVAIAVDGSGNAYITGGSYSTNFPTTTGAFHITNAGSEDAFVAKFNPSLSGAASLVYSTLLGGGGDDEGFAIAVDSSGNAYLTGFTVSGSVTPPSFPTKNPFQSDLNGVENTYVTKLNSTGTGLVFSSYLGGDGSDYGQGIALGTNGTVYLTGQTNSLRFPVTAGALQTSADNGNCSASPCQDDAYVTKISADGSAIVYSTLLSGSFLDSGYGIAVDSFGNAYATGVTESIDFPATAGAYETLPDLGTCSVAPCGQDVFITKVSGLALPAGVVSPTTFDFGSSTVVGTTNIPQTFTLSNVGDAQMTVSGISVNSISCGINCPPPGQFNIQNTGTCPATPFNLPASGGSCTIDINFEPFTSSLTTATLAITDNAGNSPQTAALSGTGLITGALVSFSGTSFSNGLTFSPQLVGTTSLPQTVTITNIGVATLNFAAPIRATVNYSITNNTCGAPLAPDFNCTFDVTFSPPFTGSGTGTVTVTDDAPFSPQTFTVTGTGFAPVPQISQPLVPAAAAAGSAGFTLKINGTGFVPGAMVMWNGVLKTPSSISSNQVQVPVSASDIAVEGTALVYVINPVAAASASNVAFFQVTSPAVAQLNRTDYPAAVLPTTLRPYSVVTGDFNGDGKLDVAVASTGACSIISLTFVCGPGSVAISLGNGDGTFQFETSYTTLPTVGGIAEGDFNGDHILDLAVTSAQDSVVSIFLGNGDGTFQSRMDFDTGTGPIGIAVGDFDGDGKLDIVTADNANTANSISILLGNGDGTFQNPVDYPTGTGPYAVAVGDFNGDFKPDVAVANQTADTVSILLGNGDGTFGAKTDFASGPAGSPQGPTAVGTGDFNSDGKLDLAVANTTANTAGILLGNGNGTFQTVTTYSTSLGGGPASPSSISIGDLDGDGVLDVALVNQNANNFTLLTGFGNGTFSSSTGYPTGGAPLASATGDFNRDGRLDLVAANANDGTFSVLLQQPFAGLDAELLTFSDQNVGTTSSPPQTVTVSNPGSAPLAISGVSLDGVNAGDFVISNDICPLVARPGSCANPSTSGFYNSFPTGSYPFSGIFYVSAPNGSGDRLVVGTPSGGTAALLTAISGIATPSVSNQEFCDFVALSPTIQAFAYVPTVAERSGDFSAFTGLLIDPTTGAAVPGGILSPSSTFWAWRIPANAFRTVGLAPGAQCTFDVATHPTTTGVLSASIFVANNAGGALQVVNLTATGVQPVAIVSPSSLTFANTSVGGTSAGQTVTLTNGPGSTAALNIASISLAGTNPGDFQIAPGTTPCTVPGALAIGSFCDFVVTFKPTTSGTRTASVTVTDDAPPGIQTVTLSGTGTGPVPFVHQPLVPASAAPGGAGFTLTVNGAEFISGATVEWNGTALTTTFVNGQQLTAAVPASNITAAGTAAITVVNSLSGASSNVVYFPVRQAVASFSFANANSSPISVGTYPVVALIGDFNGDGKPDMAVANRVGNSVTILVGNGDGTFTSASGSPITVGTNPDYIAAGDFNNDGFLDLAVVNGGSNSVTILLGNGDGTFNASASSPATGTQPDSVAVGDFNGDGNVDMAVVSYGSNSVKIFLGNGDGTFTSPGGNSTGSAPGEIVTGDLNHDGKLDLAIVNYCGTGACGFNGTVTILLGNGNGTFTPAASPSTGTSPLGLVAGDFNADGILDLATADYNNNNLTILLGNGDGTFTASASTPTVGNAPDSVAMGDFNGDGKLDLAVVNTAGASVSLLLGNGDGTFTSTTPIPSGGVQLSAVAVGDFNGDGALDVALPDLNNNAVYVLVQQASTAPGAMLSTTSLNFSNVNLGTTSTAQSVTLTNNGTATLNISGITITGTNSGDFALSAGTTPCGATLATSANCDFSVTFTPTAVGSRSASVTISDDATGSPQTVSLSGTGVGVPKLTLSASSLTMPTTPLNLTCTPRTLTLTNSGSGTLTISNILSSDNTVFATSTGTCLSTPLASGANCQVTVTFHPTVTGTVTGTLTITSNAPGSPNIVNLSGTGQPACPLSAAAASEHVLRGTDRTTFTVQPNVTCQATDQIQLACVNANPATCAFNPGTIQNPQRSMLTMQGLNNVTGNSLPFQVTGTSPDFIQRTLDLAVDFSDFWFTPYPAETTVASGERATFAVSVVPINGLTGQMRLTCTGAPAGGRCTVVPSSITVGKDAPVQVQVRVETSSGAMAPVGEVRRTVPPNPGSRILILVLGLAMLLMAVRAVGARAVERIGTQLPISYFRLPISLVRVSGLALLLMIVTWASCGGGGTSQLSGPGSRTGRYSIVMTGTFTPSSGSGMIYDPSAPPLTHNVTMTLHVQ